MLRATALTLILFFIGIALLIAGAEALIRGASRLAARMGLSPLVIGLTVVAMGTSAPELAVSLQASFTGEADIALGNVVGSNIFNILAIIGLSSIAAPDGIPVAPSAISFDLPIMIAVSVACLPILFTGNRIDRWEGFLFLGYYVAYTVYLILKAAEHDALPVFSGVLGFFVVPLTIVTVGVLAVRAWRAQRKR